MLERFCTENEHSSKEAPPIWRIAAKIVTQELQNELEDSEKNGLQKSSASPDLKMEIGCPEGHSAQNMMNVLPVSCSVFVMQLYRWSGADRSYRMTTRRRKWKSKNATGCSIMKEIEARPNIYEHGCIHTYLNL